MKKFSLILFFFAYSFFSLTSIAIAQIFIPSSVKAAFTAPAGLTYRFNGGGTIDGRNYTSANQLVSPGGTGTIAIWSTGTVNFPAGSAMIGGTSVNGVDYPPSTTLNPEIILQNQIFPYAYPLTPDQVMGGSAEGFVEGALKNFAKSGKDGSQYITTVGGSIPPYDTIFSGITYIDWAGGTLSNINGSGILIINNLNIVAAAIQISYTNFTGLIILSNNINLTIRQGGVIGAVFVTGPSAPTSTLTINNLGFIHYSSQAISEACRLVFTQIISPVGGEMWRAGDVDTIKWIGRSNLNYEISYTTDFGNSWNSIVDTLISSDVDSIHYFLWTIPNTPSYLCKIRINNTISENVFTILENPTTLWLKFLIQGRYNGNSSVSDSATVELHNMNSPYNLVESQRAFLDSSGFCFTGFSNAIINTPYYIVIKHRNSIETWSKIISFTSKFIFFDFSFAQSQAYGGNQIKVGSKWCIYSGDVNQDGNIDIFDLSNVDNAAASFIGGYVATDVNGDNSVDIFDLSIVDNNIPLFVSKIIPAGTPASRQDRNILPN